MLFGHALSIPYLHFWVTSLTSVSNLLFLRVLFFTGLRPRRKFAETSILAIKGITGIFIKCKSFNEEEYQSNKKRNNNINLTNQLYFCTIRGFKLT